MSSIIFFASDVPLKEIEGMQDFELKIDTKRRTVDDGGADDLFSIFSIDRSAILEVETEKKYFAVLEWFMYTPGRAARIIEYLHGHLKTADEVEFWHVWQDMDFGHRIRKTEIPIAVLTPDDIRELVSINVTKEPVTDRCYVITK